MEDLWEGVESEAARRLLRAAVELLAARGYGGASTREIAERAGLSPAAMYVHFPTKAELLYTIIHTVHVTAHAAVVAGGSARGGVRDSPAAMVRGMVYALAAFHSRHQLAARVTQNELAALPPAQWATIRGMRDATEGLILAEVARGAAGGEFDVADLTGTSRAIVSMCVDVARWYHPEGPRTPDEVGALYAHLAARMLGVKP
ncbi:TetR/AcrR family transcriptional regulator [Nonomuraea soli]|uniref:AcrR family transcriptional regulator n=1 Tax=Nonomuraea soli TaxID=1032476 RepID=A0A7W0CDN2_9ACTN|nr:TetR/AcrR family transcriptional regulator [Nonomuraea soli]MBA2889236.1 AcrR family transcriptional regulator [Nonomuraea soli]